MLLLRSQQRRTLLGPSYIDTITPAWVAQVVTDGGSVSGAQQARVSAMVEAIDTAGIWAKLDRFWLFAAEDQFQALRDVKALALATKTGAPTWVASQGYTGNIGATAYIGTGFNPTTAAELHSQTSCSFGVYARTALGSGTTAATFGAYDATYASRLYPWYTDNNLYWTINGVGGAYAHPSPTSGQYILSANGSGSAIYHNGSSAATGAAPAGLANQPFLAGYASTVEHAVVYIGGFLTAGEVATLDAAVNAYMTSLGTNVY